MEATTNDDLEQPTGDEPSELDGVYEMLHKAETERDEYKVQLEYMGGVLELEIKLNADAVNNIDRITAERDGARRALVDLNNAVGGLWHTVPGNSDERNRAIARVEVAQRTALAALTPAVSDAE